MSALQCLRGIQLTLHVADIHILLRKQDNAPIHCWTLKHRIFCMLENLARREHTYLSNTACRAGHPISILYTSVDRTPRDPSLYFDACIAIRFDYFSSQCFPAPVRWYLHLTMFLLLQNCPHLTYVLSACLSAMKAPQLHPLVTSSSNGMSSKALKYLQTAPTSPVLAVEHRVWTYCTHKVLQSLSKEQLSRSYGDAVPVPAAILALNFTTFMVEATSSTHHIWPLHISVECFWMSVFEDMTTSLPHTRMQYNCLPGNFAVQGLVKGVLHHPQTFSVAFG